MGEPELREPLVLDVREDIRQGREPFQKIMQAVERLEPGQEFVLINSFEPRPLYSVLERRGFAHRTKQEAKDYWEITFIPKG